MHRTFVRLRSNILDTTAGTFAALIERLFKPRYVKLIIPVDALRSAGERSDDPRFHEACIAIADHADRTRSLFLPKWSLEFDRLDQRTDDAHANGNPSGDDKSNAKGVVLSGVPRDDCLQWDHGGLKRVVHPLANTDRAKPCGYGRSVRPVSGDAGHEGRGRYAGQRMPPMQVLANSRNAHYAIPSSFWPGVQTTPGTLADDLGCLAALLNLAAVAYILLVLS
jgi:hypothetical protein